MRSRKVTQRATFRFRYDYTAVTAERDHFGPVRIFATDRRTCKCDGVRAARTTERRGSRLVEFVPLSFLPSVVPSVHYGCPQYCSVPVCVTLN